MQKIISVFFLFTIARGRPLWWCLIVIVLIAVLVIPCCRQCKGCIRPRNRYFKVYQEHFRDHISLICFRSENTLNSPHSFSMFFQGIWEHSCCTHTRRLLLLIIGACYWKNAVLWSGFAAKWSLNKTRQKTQLTINSANGKSFGRKHLSNCFIITQGVQLLSLHPPQWLWHYQH